LQLPRKLRKAEHVSRLQTPVLRPVGRTQRQDAEVDQVLPVDARETFGQNGPQSQIPRRQRSVLAARSLPIVRAANNGMASGIANLHGAVVIGLINDVEAIAADFGNITAKWE